MSEKYERALKAKDKKAPIGPDIELEKYSLEASPHKPIQSLENLKEDYYRTCRMAGIDVSEKERSGSFFQLDHSVIFQKTKQTGLEIMDTPSALKKYDWLRNYGWTAIPVDMDKYTAHAELKQTSGYFIRSLPGSKSTFPLQACLFIGTEGLAQNVHNIIIAEENSELHIITGCTVAPHINSALHLGISEFYVKKNSKISFTMIHNWARDVEVRPRTGVIVEENGTYISNYICMNPVKNLQAYPVAYLAGQNAKATFQSILYAPENSLIDLGSRAYLKSNGTKTQMMTRAIAKDNGTIVARGHIIGEALNIKGHIECRGLMLSDTARIHSIPELEAKVSGVDLSHEAAVGKISEEEILYLTSRGLTIDEATATIIRGFLNVDIEGLPTELGKEMNRMLRISAEKVL
jgi:Fe-S cluster assembly scaffold protein SufB